MDETIKITIYQVQVIRNLHAHLNSTMAQLSQNILESQDNEPYQLIVSTNNKP